MRKSNTGRDPCKLMFGIFNRYKSMLKEISAVSFANIITTFISAAFWLYLASILSASTYGSISYLIAVGTISATVSTLGLQNTLTVFTAKNERVENPSYLLGTVSSIGVALVVFLIFQNISVSLFTFGAALFSLITSYQLGLKSYTSYSRFVLLQRIIAVVSAVILYRFMGVEGVVLGFALSFFPFLKNIFLIKRKPGILILRPKFHFMMNNYAARISQILVAWSDKIIIFPLFGSQLLGNYQLGIQFLSLMTVIPNAVYNYLLPQDASGNKRNKIKKLLVLFSTLICLLGIFVIPIGVEKFFPKYDSSIPMIRIVSFAVIPITLNLIYMSKFLGQDKSRFATIGTIIQLVIQLLGLVILGKYYGIIGLASAVVLGSVIQSIYYITIDFIVIKKHLR